MGFYAALTTERCYTRARERQKKRKEAHHAAEQTEAL